MKLLIEKFKAVDNKIKAAGIIFLVAIIFILVPTGKNTVSEKTNMNFEVIKKETEKELSIKLSKIVGVERAEIVITYLNDGILEYQTDDKIDMKNDKENEKKTSHQTQIEKKTVFDGGKNTIIKSRKMPEIKGVCIFYSGDENEKTIKNLYSAARGSLGLELHKIEVINIKN